MLLGFNFSIKELVICTLPDLPAVWQSCSILLISIGIGGEERNTRVMIPEMLECQHIGRGRELCENMAVTG